MGVGHVPIGFGEKFLRERKGAGILSLGLKAKVTIIAGLLVALLFLVLGIRALGRDARDAQAPAPAMAARPVAQVAVLAVATRAIETGQTITADMVRNASGDPARFPAIATPAEVIGKVATRRVPAGAMIDRAAIDTATKLAIRVPVGMRAMSIDTTAEIAVAGLVRPGDRVDVQVVYPGADAISGARGEGSSRTRTLLQMVPVLAVGETVVGSAPVATSEEGKYAAPPPPARTVTLALHPDQVPVLSLAKTTGALTLSLRNPADGAAVAVNAAASDPLPAPAAPKVVAAMPAPAAPARPAPARHSIELVVGKRHDIIYSGETQR